MADTLSGENRHSTGSEGKAPSVNCRLVSSALSRKKPNNSELPELGFTGEPDLLGSRGLVGEGVGCRVSALVWLDQGLGFTSASRMCTSGCFRVKASGCNNSQGARCNARKGCLQDPFRLKFLSVLIENERFKSIRHRLPAPALCASRLCRRLMQACKAL